jgi:HK97 family phage portal protein
LDLFGRKRREEKMTQLINMAVKNLSIRQPFYLGGVAIYPANDTKTLISSTFETNITFYSVIKRISQKFGHLPRYVFQEKTKKSLDADMIENDLSKLLLRPNEYQGQDAFFESVAAQYLLTGEAFIYKNRGDVSNIAGKIVELIVLPTQFMNVIPDREDFFGVGGYELDITGNKLSIPRENVIHWKTANPIFDTNGSHLRGFNPLQPQKRSIQQSNDVTDASTAMFQNGGAKGVLFNESLDNLSQEQMDHLKSVVDAKINNKDVKGAVASVQGKWGYLGLGSSSVDMQLIEADEALIKKICNANGLPYELFQSDTTFANKKEAWHFFITNTLMPMAASLYGEMTRSLVKDFGGKGFIKTDFDELPEMQQMRIQAAISISTMDYLSRNEKRMMAGFEPRPEKEMDEIFIAPNQVPITESRIDTEPNTNTSDYEEDI